MDYSDFVKRFGIGLTGNIATGKSTVAGMIRNQGYTVIDADILARQAVAPQSPALIKIVTRFGTDVLLSDGNLDRKKLGAIVFADSQKKHDLEQIMHPAIHELLEQKLKELGLLAQPKVWFYEASLLVETERHRNFRSVWCTYCSAAEQLRRLMKRDRIDEEQAKKIIANQLSMDKKLQVADVKINTEVSDIDLEQIVKAALAKTNATI